MVAGTSTPGSISNKVINDLKSNIEQVFKLLDLKDGLFHVQFIIKNQVRSTKLLQVIVIYKLLNGDLKMNSMPGVFINMEVPQKIKALFIMMINQNYSLSIK